MSALVVALALFAVAGAQAPPKPVEAAKTPAPKPLHPPVTSLDVTVVDPAGKPVEGAFVMAVPLQGAYRSFGGLAPEKVRSTVTGREGKARLESLPPGPWNVTSPPRPVSATVTPRAERSSSPARMFSSFAPRPPSALQSQRSPGREGSPSPTAS